MFAREAALKDRAGAGGILETPLLSAAHKVIGENCFITVSVGKESCAKSGTSKTGPNIVMSLSMQKPVFLVHIHPVLLLVQHNARTSLPKFCNSTFV